MGQTIAGTVALIIAVVAFAVAIRKRLSGDTTYGNCQGGGHFTFLGAIAICSFIASWGAIALTENPAFFVTAVVAFVVGYRDQSRANKLYRDTMDALRANNAKNHPGIFDSPPPTDLGQVHGDLLDLYDATTCTFIGVAEKSDVLTFIETFSAPPDNGPNDIYVMPDSFDLIPTSEFSDGFTQMMDRVFDSHDDILLRWMPHQKRQITKP